MKISFHFDRFLWAELARPTPPSTGGATEYATDRSLKSLAVLAVPASLAFGLVHMIRMCCAIILTGYQVWSSLHDLCCWRLCID